MTAHYRENAGAMPVDCQVALSGNDINIYLPEGGGLVIWNLARVSDCSYAGATLVVKYKEAELTCSGEAARQIHSQWLNREVAEKKTSSGSRVFRNVIITLILVIIGIVLLMYFYVLPWASRKATSLIPRAAEIELGEKMSASFKEGKTGTTRADSLLNAFGAAINFRSSYPLKLHVLHSPDINAFAVPGGNIFVHTGILCAMDSHEQLAALLAHEVTHVEKRHSLRSVSRAVASSFLIAAIFGDVSGITGALISQADEFTQLSYSRDLETEADLHGLEVLRENGIGQQGMLDLLALLDREHARAPRMMKYLSTHPETGERIEAVKQNVVNRTSSQDTDQKLKALFELLQKEVQ